MTFNGKEYTKEELNKIAKESHSIKEFSCKLGYKCGNYTKMKIIINKYNLDTSHFIKREEGFNKKCLNYFKINSYVKPTTLYKGLVNLRGEKCEKCGISEWEGSKIKLEVHHIDGDRTNNSLENVQLLCPNCHSQTDNWRGKNKPKVFIEEEKFVNSLKNSSSIREALIKLNLAPKGGNYERAKRIIIKYDLKELKDDITRSIIQIDPNTNKVINVFKSIADANRYLGVKNNCSGIRKCVAGYYKTAYGYIWKKNN